MADSIGTTDLAAISEIVPTEWWRKVFLTTLEANLVFKKWGLMGTIPKHEGKTVKFPRVENITTSVTSAMEGQDPDATAWSANEISAQLAEYKQWHRVSDFYRDASLNGTMQQLVERIAYKSALDIDTQIRDAVFTAGGSAQIAGTAIATTSMKNDASFYLDVSEIREATSGLRGANVPTAEEGYYVGLMHPTPEFDLQGDSDWQDIAKYTVPENPRLTKAATADVYGVRFYVTTQALKSTDGASAAASRDAYDTYIFGDEYYGLSELGDLELIVKSPFPGSPLNSYDSLGWKYKFVAKELVATRMTRIKTTASLGG